jgi:sugar lactone lactonase YvrE
MRYIYREPGDRVDAGHTVTEFVPLTTARCRLGESPVWVPSLGQLWWIDMHRDTIHRYDWQRRESEIQKLSDRSTFIVPCIDGSAIGALQKGLCRIPEQGQLASLMVPVESGTPDTSINDGKTGPDGRLYFGTRDLAQRREMGGLYRLDDDLVAHRLTDRVTAGNGIDWSPDASVLYFVDTGDYRVWAFDFDARDGSVSQKRVFASVAEPDGLPDGLTVDALGGVWVALYGGGRLHRYSPDGQLTEVISTPVRYPTSCCFAGPGLDALVVTSAYARIEDAGQEPSELDGAVLVTKTGIKGKPVVLCRTPL